MEEESHMAVVYCLSSSGALSFKSNVSTATTALDTWLGLSERAKRRQADSNRAQDAYRQLYLQEYRNTLPQCAHTRWCVFFVLH